MLCDLPSCLCAPSGCRSCCLSPEQASGQLGSLGWVRAIRAPLQGVSDRAVQLPMLGLLVIAGSPWASARGHLPAVGICPPPTWALARGLNGSVRLGITIIRRYCVSCVRAFPLKNPTSSSRRMVLAAREQTRPDASGRVRSNTTNSGIRVAPPGFPAAGGSPRRTRLTAPRPFAIMCSS